MIIRFIFSLKKSKSIAKIKALFIKRAEKIKEKREKEVKILKYSNKR